MIKFDKNIELDLAMKNLLLSMVKVNEYLTSILDYNEKVLTPSKERKLIEILKKYDIPYNHLKYKEKELTNNPYYKNIKLNDIYSDTVRYECTTIKRKTLMNMDFHNPLGKYLFHYDPLGYFDTDITLPALKEDDKVWMSPAISEIQSMKNGVEKGHGKCMTMGLGIGVLPYLWLLKEEVESVTIVEFNKNIIDLFDKYIRPQFPINKPLEIIHGNAFDYYNEIFLNKFDYVYIDFWESSEDGLEYYTKLMEKNIDLPHLDYWIEDSILCLVKYIMVPYLNTLYEEKSIYEFIMSQDDISKVIAKKVNKYFKGQTQIIKTESELLNLIHNKKVLRKILGCK